VILSPNNTTKETLNNRLLITLYYKNRSTNDTIIMQDRRDTIAGLSGVGFSISWGIFTGILNTFTQSTPPLKCLVKGTKTVEGFTVTYTAWDKGTLSEKANTFKWAGLNWWDNVTKTTIKPVGDTVSQLGKDTGDWLKKLGDMLNGLILNLGKWLPLALVGLGAFWIFSNRKKG